TLGEGTSDNVALLFRSQRVKANCITGYTDGQLRIFFRMLNCIFQSFTTQNVNVQVLTTFNFNCRLLLNFNFTGMQTIENFWVYKRVLFKGFRDNNSCLNTIFKINSTFMCA